MRTHSLVVAIAASALVIALGATASIVSRLSAPVAVAAKPLDSACTNCGVVLSVRPIEIKATPPAVRYQIEVRMSDGSVKTLSSNTQPAWKAGDRVRLQNGRVVG